jgi:hypothetical protein
MDLASTAFSGSLLKPNEKPPPPPSLEALAEVKAFLRSVVTLKKPLPALSPVF